MNIENNKKQIKILLIADQIFASTGGTEQHLSFLLRYINSKNYKIIFVLLKNTSYYEENLYPIKPIYLNFRSFKYPCHMIATLIKIKNLINIHNIDIVHAVNPDSELLAILSTNLCKTLPVIAVRRNMGYWKTKILNLRHRITSPLLTHIFANCEAALKNSIDHEGVFDKNISVIYNPIIPERYKIDEKIDYKKHYNIESADFVVGIVANLRPIKDHTTFINAAKIIIDKMPNVKFIIAGHGSELYIKKLIQLCNKLKITSNVIFTGTIDNPTQLMKCFNIGVLSSRSEGFSNSLIEYCNVGLPVVATDVGGNKEIIQNGINGYIVEVANPRMLANSILDLLKDKNKMECFGKKSKENVIEKFAIKKIINQYWVLYNKIKNNME